MTVLNMVLGSSAWWRRFSLRQVDKCSMVNCMLLRADVECVCRCPCGVVCQSSEFVRFCIWSRGFVRCSLFCTDGFSGSRSDRYSLVSLKM